MVVKEYEDPRTRRATILLDTFLPNLNDRKRRSRLERAISFSAALAEALLAESYVLRFRTWSPDLVDLALEPRHGILADLRHVLAGLRPSRVHNLADLVPEPDPRTDDVFFVLPIGDEPLPDTIPSQRSIVIPADEMRNLMYYVQ
jgi:uncharacterized protein (DUF58 family)